MRNGWKTVQFGDCITMLSGGTPSKANASYWTGDIPWVSCKDMKTERIFDAEDHLSEEGAVSGTRMVTPGTVLIVVRGMILAKELPVAVAKRAVAFNQDLKALKCARSLSDQFLFYWLKSKAYDILGIADEAAHGTKRLQTDRLQKLEMDVPPTHVQAAIVAVLSAYDDLIENNTRRVKILEEMARMLYREWFVHFRFPGHEKVRMVDSELGPIPKGWAVKTLGDVLQLEYGKALKAEGRTGGTVAVYGSSGVVGYHGQKLADGPGIIVGRKGNVGSVFFCESDFWVIDTAYYVRTSLPLQFVYFNLRTQNFLNNDAAVPGLNRNQALSLPVVVPDTKHLQEFKRIVEPMFNLKHCLQKRNANLRTTRDLLLPKLISGEIPVDAAGEESAVAKMLS